MSSVPTVHEHVLPGCRPEPLAHYLKALAVLRLVARQADATARGAWRGETFVLATRLDRSALERFFLAEYRPTPVVAPWNGGSGFYPKDNREAIATLASSPAARLEGLRAAVTQASLLLARLGITEKVDKEGKPRLLEACRGTLPDETVEWLDAALLLTADPQTGETTTKFPPLLGTGGNDGRLDFTNNFMQRLLDLIDPATGAARPGSAALLGNALFAEPVDALVGAAVGQFLPAGAGGANAEAGLWAESRVNPWDFVLMIEGSLAFAAAGVRRFEHDAHGALSYPFTVRPVGAGYASAAQADEAASRAEMWLPLWERPASAAEVQALLAEGRAQVGGRPARNGIDFARAVAALGVDRGLSAFQRYGFQVRNGLAYFATPLGRYAVRESGRVGLLLGIDGWLDAFRRRAGGERAPASVARALRRLDEAVLELCRRDDALRVREVLAALGACERAMARSLRWTEESRLSPVPPLQPEWLEEAGKADGVGVELRLAASLASVVGRYGGDDDAPAWKALRSNLEPVAFQAAGGWLRPRWDAAAGRDVVASGGGLIDTLNAAFARRLLQAVAAGMPTYPDTGRLAAELGDVADFVEGRVDDGLLEELLWGCLLLDGPKVKGQPLAPRGPQAGSAPPSALYALLKLCFPGGREIEPGAAPVPILPGIHRVAAAGRGAEASRLAARRLRGSGFAPQAGVVHQEGESARRTAAALLFPLRLADLRTLKRLVRPLEPKTESPPETAAAVAEQGAAR